MYSPTTTHSAIAPLVTPHAPLHAPARPSRPLTAGRRSASPTLRSGCRRGRRASRRTTGPSTIRFAPHAALTDMRLHPVPRSARCSVRCGCPECTCSGEGVFIGGPRPVGHQRSDKNQTKIRRRRRNPRFRKIVFPLFPPRTPLPQKRLHWGNAHAGGGDLLDARVGLAVC